MPLRSGKNAVRVSPSISAICFALLPKCPVCLALLLAPLGISFPTGRTAFALTGWLLLTVPIGFLCVSERGKLRAGPLPLGAAGALLMGIGRFSVDSAVLLAVGGALIVIAFLWAARSSPSPSQEPCGGQLHQLRQETPKWLTL
jgi:hypothetical protein